MTQLIINNNIELPEVRGGKYSASETDLKVQIEMISGRLVEEIRGQVWTVSYSKERLPDATWRALKAVLKGGSSFPATFLVNDADDMASATVLCTALTEPTFAWSRDNVPYWTGLSFTLREVRPHD